MTTEPARMPLSHFLTQPLLLFCPQNPPDPPQIYLTSVGDPPSLIPLGPVKGAGSPPLQVSMGPHFQQQDGCGGAAHPGSFSTHSPSSAHPNQPSPVFVIINAPAPQQQQQTTVAAPSAPPPPLPPVVIPPTGSAQHPIIIKEEHLPSQEELLEIVSLEEKQAEEVRWTLTGLADKQYFSHCCQKSRLSFALFAP